MGKYLAFVSGGLQAVLRYRMSLVISIVSTAASAAALIFLWRAVYAETGSGPGGFDIAGITTYLLAAQLLGVLHHNGVDYEIAQDVARGDIAVMLVRPVSYPIMRFFASVPVVAVNAVVVALPMVLVAALLFPLKTPHASDTGLFALAVLLSVVIAFALNMLTGLVAFVTTNMWGVSIVRGSIVSFFAGNLVPLDVMPDMLRKVALVLPFQSMINGPVQLLLGRYDSPLPVLGVQVFWAMALLGLCVPAWKAAVRRTEVLRG